MSSPSLVKFSTPVPVKIDLGHENAKKMLDILKSTPLPDSPPLSSAQPWQLGIDLKFLKDAKKRFEESWSFASLEQRINNWPNFLAKYKIDDTEAELHFVHVKSNRKDAVPLILLHGWPGSFFDFHKVVEPLTNPPDGHPAFHVVIPSLPGYFKSTLPQTANWDNRKVAAVFHHLMKDVLGYTAYAGQGGDWGSLILRFLGAFYPESIKLLHFNVFIGKPLSFAGNDQGENDTSERGLRRKALLTTGMAYVMQQATKPFTIGLAIASSPLAVLTWIGEKFHDWSDPACLDVVDLLDTVALYYLSGSFPTSVMMYNQSAPLFGIFAQEADKWKIAGKIGYSHYPYEIAGATPEEIQAAGQLVFYDEKQRGGHFPALDVPAEFVKDLRKFVGENW